MENISVKPANKIIIDDIIINANFLGQHEPLETHIDSLVPKRMSDNEVILDWLPPNDKKELCTL